MAAASQNNLSFVLQQQDSSGVNVIDRLVSVNYPGLTGQFTEGVISTTETIVGLPFGLTNILQIYIKNTSTLGNITVKATPVGGAGSGIIAAVAPGAISIPIWTPVAIGGYSSVSLTGDAPNCTFELFIGGSAAGQSIPAGNLSGIFDVKAFGAKGDGTTDDTAAIQATLDAAAAIGQGATVYLGNGAPVYAVTQLQLSSHAHLTGGNGPLGARLLRISGGIGPVIRMKPGVIAQGLLLENFQVDVNNQEGGTFTVTGATNATPIVITTSAAHGMFSGALVNIAGVVTNTAANGEWRISLVSPTTFSLDRSVGNGVYGGGGTVTVHCTGIALGDEAATDYSLTSSIQNVTVTHATGWGVRLNCNAIAEARNLYVSNGQRGILITGPVFYGYNLNSEFSVYQEVVFESFAGAIYGLQIEGDPGRAVNDAALDVIEVADSGVALHSVYCSYTGTTRRSLIGLLGPSVAGTFASAFVGTAITNAGGTFTNLIYDSVNSLSTPAGITHRTLPVYSNGNTQLAPVLASLLLGPGAIGTPALAFNGRTDVGLTQLAAGFISLITSGVHGIAWDNGDQYMRAAFALQWTTGTPFDTVDLRLRRGAANILSLDNGAGVGAVLEGVEMTAPAAGAVNTGRLYFEDNGSGKTRLMCLFNTGAAQQIAIQP